LTPTPPTKLRAYVPVVARRLSVEEARTISQIGRYLTAEHSHGRAWVFNGDPLIQKVTVHTEQWSALVTRRDLEGATLSGVMQALTAIRIRGGFVDRALLTDLALRADDSGTSRVACWFATMCWGAGPRQRSRLRQWVRALSPSLGADRT